MYGDGQGLQHHVTEHTPHTFLSNATDDEVWYCGFGAGAGFLISSCSPGT